MAEQRFIVTEVWGYPVTTRQSGSGAKKAPSYSVLDTVDCYREVGKFYAGRSIPNALNERRAYALCRQLNRTEREWEARFA